MKVPSLTHLANNVGNVVDKKWATVLYYSHTSTPNVEYFNQEFIREVCHVAHSMHKASWEVAQRDRKSWLLLISEGERTLCWQAGSWASQLSLRVLKHYRDRSLRYQAGDHNSLQRESENKLSWCARQGDPLGAKQGGSKTISLQRQWQEHCAVTQYLEELQSSNDFEKISFWEVKIS